MAEIDGVLMNNRGKVQLHYSLSLFSRHKIFAKTLKCLVFVAIPAILDVLASGSPDVQWTARRKCRVQFEDWACGKKLTGEYLRSAFPCAFTVISLGFRRTTMSGWDESRNPLRTSDTSDPTGSEYCGSICNS